MAAGLVVGLGHPDRGDDAVGWLVADEVARRRPDLAVRRVLEPLALLSLLDAHERVVVVDAAIANSPPGVVSVHDLAASGVPAMPGTSASSHGASLAEVLEVARAVATLPRHLAVVTVSATTVGLGEPVTDDVRAAVPAAAEAVLAWLRCG